MFKVLLCFLALSSIDYGYGLAEFGANESLPVVMWHGMGDTCCFSFSLGSFRTFLIDILGSNTYVKSIRIGNNVVEDYESGYFVHPNKQIDDACHQIASDPKLKNGYNAIGFSQGSQFLRAVAQRCPEPRINNLISLGGQHQGVFGLPNCPSLSSKTCDKFRKMLNYAAYTSWLQSYLVQATYWHNPLKEEIYRKSSTFLADINNELTINQTYVENLKKLNKFVLVKFSNDTIVQPIDTEWFQFYTPNQDKVIQPFAESNAVKNLGLNDLVASNKIVFLETVGNHLKFTTKWFKANILPYLNGDI
ncbi:palmitoyl-protein thioesterase 1 isoform X1 [Sitodiplosis mosellana]|uniref:palmitoyl-protein thioesterase 1 isoform X1 n=1 Tax=Sitodiplosis mosellana TaxID=263140 RepID=UPI002444D33C|nr:palmitoyl-protein thioesterase 1 isoform X1 [Sitodiplosis mosellana]